MEEKQLRNLLKRMGVHQVTAVTRFVNQEDNEPYDAWRIDTPEKCYVLKRAKGFERETYEGFFRDPTAYAPQLMAVSELEGADYLLMEYIPGRNLMCCTRDALIQAA